MTLKGYTSNTGNTKYIWHSEKSKNTCNACNSLDGKIFYSKDEIPNKPHPNCRCYIESVENISSAKDAKCDCMERVEILIDNMENVIQNIPALLKNIDLEILDFKEIKDKIKDVLQSLNIEHDNFEEEVEIHRPNYYPNKAYEQTNNRIKEINELSVETENKINELFKMTDIIKNFKSSSESFICDIYELEPQLEEYYHTKNECKNDEEIKNISSKVTDICKQLNEFYTNLYGIQKRKEIIQNAVNAAKEYRSFYDKKKFSPKKVWIDSKKTLKDDFYILSGKAAGLTMPIASSNLQNAVDNFNMAKKNEYAHILNSVDELADKNLQKEMKKVGIPKDTRGVVYNSESSESRKLYQSKVVQDFISENHSDLTSNKQKKTNFIEFELKSGLDTFAGIQHCVLYNPHITDDGYFEAVIFDYYDFEYRNGKNIPTKINNWGYSMQERGLLENQFNVYYIRKKYDKIKQ